MQPFFLYMLVCGRAGRWCVGHGVCWGAVRGYKKIGLLLTNYNRMFVDTIVNTIADSYFGIG